MPKWHIVGDSIHEMVVVGKDHLRKRQRLKEASCYFQWLICKRRMAVYCCFCWYRCEEEAAGYGERDSV